MKGLDIISVLFLGLVGIIIAALIMKIAPKSLIIPSFVFISICLWIAYDYMLLRRYRMKMKKLQSVSENTNDIHKDTEDNSDKPPPNDGENPDNIPTEKSEQQYDAEIEKFLYEQDMGLSSKSGKLQSKFIYPKSKENNHTSLLNPLPNLIDATTMDNAIMSEINYNEQAGYPFDLSEGTYNSNSSHIYSGQQWYTKLRHPDGNFVTNSNSYIDIPKASYEKDIERKQHQNEFDIDMYSGRSNIKELHPMMGSSADTRLANRMKYMQMQSKLSMDLRATHHKPQMQKYLEEELREAYEQRHWWENDQLSQVFGD